MLLTPQQSVRFARNTVMPEIGESGQRKLLDSRVLVIGAGGLGSTAIYSLAAAGIGHIGIADGDNVELSNLQRQILHTESRIGMNKAESAREAVCELSSETKVTVYGYYASPHNILDMINDYDFVIDATDRAENKYLINDACVLADKPFCHGGILRWGGQIMTVIPHKTPCLRCVFGDLTDDKSPSCAQSGIINMVCSMAGSVQAAEAVKYILDKGELLTGRLLNIDALTMSFRTLNIPQPDAECSVCSSSPHIHDLSWYSTDIFGEKN